MLRRERYEKRRKRRELGRKQHFIHVNFCESCTNRKIYDVSWCEDCPQFAQLRAIGQQYLELTTHYYKEKEEMERDRELLQQEKAEYFEMLNRGYMRKEICDHFGMSAYQLQKFEERIEV